MTFSEQFPNYDVDELGIVYKNNEPVKPFKSNKYYQVVLYDYKGTKKVYGVHTIVAMKYLDYFPGCVVHHKNNDTHDNRVSNLEIYTRSEHSRMHNKNNDKLKLLNKGKIAWNRGLKMSKEFCEHCSLAAKRRHSKNNAT